jgi:hypothetical protein
MSEIEKTDPLPWIKSPKGVLEIYTNQVHATWTKDDVRVRLAQIVDNPDFPNPGSTFKGANEERAAVTFSWRAAKLLRDQLTRLIDAYESANGEINLGVKLPPSMD